MVYLLMYLCCKVDIDNVHCQLTYLSFLIVRYKLSLLFFLLQLLRCVASYLVVRFVLRSIQQPVFQPVAVAKFFQGGNRPSVHYGSSRNG